MKDILKLYENCRLCPKDCSLDRREQPGSCGMTSEIRAASAVLHRGEEPPLIGCEGSGAVFFSGCTLGCPFCQNIGISRGMVGAGLTQSELAEIFLRLQDAGAANINLVTASQFAPSIIESVEDARGSGLVLPVMWNSSGYETPETIRLLSETVNIWLPDLKTLNRESAAELFSAPDYPDTAKTALLEMAAQLKSHGGMLVEDGQMKRGMIVRHLVMPGETENSRAVFKWFAENLKDQALLSVMVQYTPVPGAPKQITKLNYIMPDAEYERLIDWLDEFDIDEGFLQAPEAASSDWIPDFNRTNPFPIEYSTPVWHWKSGLL